MAVPAHAMEISTLGEVFVQGKIQARQDGAPFNPGNRLLGLPSSNLSAETRTEVRGDGDVLGFKLRVRGVAGRDSCDCGGVLHDDLYASQAYLRWKASATTTLTVGRQMLTWGSATYRSPSNPFYFDAGRTQPLRELSGLDAVQLSSVSNDGAWHFGHVFSSGHTGGREGEDFSGSQTGSARYQGSTFARVETRHDALTLGAVAATQRHHSAFAGAYFAWEIDDAWRWWGEWGRGRRPWALRPTIAPPAFAVSQPSPRASTFLTGASYALVNGQSVQLEYLYDGHGFSRQEEGAYFSAAALVAAGLSGAQGGQAAQALVRGLRYAPASLSRHYLSAAWQSSPQDTRLFWRAMWTVNLADHSHQPSLYLESGVGERAILFVNLVINRGPSNSEFASLTRHSMTVGLKYTLF
jgi:hypothetical protein